MLIKEQGFSLMEVLIAMAISSVLLLGAARFLPALQRESLIATRKLALEDEIWLRVFTVAKHLQRAGYCHGTCPGEGLKIVGQGDCIIVQWDANSNGIWEHEPGKESDQIGFRLKDNVLETLRGTTSCEGKGWDKLTNPDAVVIDTFQVTRQDNSGFPPVLTVNMHAASKADPQTVVLASYSVTGFNL
ncbi:prepilin peptidase-dependent protein [Escherichia sp. E2593]|uniref:prepilin peptidase-dependent protein n=1 Tax=unclassified Escherichia TaxID=2608889 RepID=UPI001029C36A|nr:MULTISPECIES: prepilin peptidase-dependent protein [unclassified Escherichia]RZN43684.1 prepilin peptidase-dependent protein [Escherichia sp. E10V5]TGC06629.1 prepilin-type cleavage/methylation domain-containing protein [Escherichia sp. E2593]TLI88860.1 prepilin peptidase-dependent protein [Escherichia sp. E2593]